MTLSRRGFFGFAGSGLAATVVGAGLRAGSAQASSSLGRLIDYSAGVPSATAIANVGYLGAIRYVSDPRPDAAWMRGKPLRSSEVDDLHVHGLQVVSCYQFGTGDSMEWHGGYAAGVQHAQRAQQIHQAAGGPSDKPIYAAVDAAPSAIEIATEILPYLLGWNAVVGAPRTGVYAGSTVIDAVSTLGIAQWFWQANWGTPQGYDYVHPRAHLKQLHAKAPAVDGIAIDVNDILAVDHGQW